MGSSLDGLEGSSKEVFYDELGFYVFRDVYEPGDDTFLLAENLDVGENERVMDVGTGCGILAILAALKASWVLAVDINPSAVRCARVNARRNGVLEKIDFLCGDLFRPLKEEAFFDLILFNAPYLPAEKESKDWIEYAWSGGKSGRKIIDRFLNSISSYLKRGGRLLLVQSSLSNVDKSMLMLRELGFKAEIIDERRFLFETIVLIRAARC